MRHPPFSEPASSFSGSGSQLNNLLYPIPRHLPDKIIFWQMMQPLHSIAIEVFALRLYIALRLHLAELYLSRASRERALFEPILA